VDPGEQPHADVGSRAIADLLAGSGDVRFATPIEGVRGDDGDQRRDDVPFRDRRP
jgi:hypothetical protein